MKIVWNMLWRPGAYDFVMPHVVWSRSPGGKLDREFQVVATSAEFAKGDFCLVPGQEEVRGKMLTEFRAPRDMAGSKNLQVNFLDPYKEERMGGSIYRSNASRAASCRPSVPASLAC